MFRFVIIASNSGFISFSHYFEAIPVQLRSQLEKQAVESCLANGEREGKLHVEDSIVAYRREGVLLVLVAGTHGMNSSTIMELVHSFGSILTHHLHVLTEKSVIHRADVIHKVLEQMVRGNVLETRVNHITALSEFKGT